MSASSPPHRRPHAGLRWLGPLLLAALVWRAGPKAIAEAWHGAEGAWLALAATLNLVILVIKNGRWLRLMAAQGIAYPFGRGLRHYTVGAALGAWTPGRLGDFSKGLAVQRETGFGVARAMSSVLADRLLDAAALACVAFTMMPGSLGWSRSGGIVLLAVGAAACVLLILLLRRGSFRGRLPVAVREAMADLGRLRGARWGAVLGATLLATLVTFLQAFLVARALDLPVGFITVALAMSVASLASLLPVSVGGFGTREASVALIFSPFGVAMPQVIGFCLAHVAVTGGALAAAGAVVWMIPVGAPPSSTAGSPGWTAGRRVP